VALVRPETMRSSTSASQAQGFTALSPQHRVQGNRRLIPAVGSSDVCSAIGPRLCRQHRSVRSYQGQYDGTLRGV
jgi:hypothetical protein